MPDALIFIIPIVIVVIALVAWYAHEQAKKRREGLAAVAQQLGWRFDPSYDSGWDHHYGQFGWFTTGHSRYAYNILTGNIPMNGRQLPAAMGDYTYKVTSGSGKDRRTTTYRFSFLLVDLPYMGLPELSVRKEGLFDGFTAMLGFNDIDFESEEFSRKFHVKSPDKRFAYDLIHPQMIEFLLAETPPTFEIARSVWCGRGSGCWEPAEFARQVAWCERFLSQWPRHLMADLESRVAK